MIEISIYDEEEIHTNCTVQILRNSITGEISVGWWENGVEPVLRMPGEAQGVLG